MTKQIRAYFKNEDDVDSAQATLHKLPIKNMTVDTMPDDAEADRMILPIQTQSSGVSTGYFGALNRDNDLEPLGHEERARLTHLLEFEVRDEDYDQALAILETKDAYTDPEVME